MQTNININNADVILKKLEAFQKETSKRFGVLEDKLFVLMGLMERGFMAESNSNSLPSSSETTKSEVVQIADRKKQQERSPIRLNIVGVPDKWFTRRTFPSFDVITMDKKTGTVIQNTKGWKISVSLLSGHNVHVDHFLGVACATFPMTNGKSVISGLKLQAVTSRNGGFFRFDVSIVLPENHPGFGMPITALSKEFTVFSERSISERKVESLLDLSSSDTLSRVPGIGKKYATKLFEQGIKTVGDLAKIDDSATSRKARLELLAMIRKDRGALTEMKLAELVRNAKYVLQREEQEGEGLKGEEEEDDDDDDAEGNSHPPYVFGGSADSSLVKVGEQQEEEEQQEEQQEEDDSFLALSFLETSSAQQQQQQDDESTQACSYFEYPPAKKQKTCDALIEKQRQVMEGFNQSEEQDEIHAMIDMSLLATDNDSFFF